jgi:hypothetical protein
MKREAGDAIEPVWNRRDCISSAVKCNPMQYSRRQHLRLGLHPPLDFFGDAPLPASFELAGDADRAPALSALLSGNQLGRHGSDHSVSPCSRT